MDLQLSLLAFLSDEFYLGVAVYAAFLIITLVGAWSAASILK